MTGTVFITEDRIRGMATAIDMATSGLRGIHILEGVVEAFQSDVGRPPSVAMDMDFDQALEALMDSIEDENQTRGQDEKIEIIEQNLLDAAQDAAYA